jgi:hypothetical protein
MKTHQKRMWAPTLLVVAAAAAIYIAWQDQRPQQVISQQGSEQQLIPPTAVAAPAQPAAPPPAAGSRPPAPMPVLTPKSQSKRAPGSVSSSSAAEIVLALGTPVNVSGTPLRLTATGFADSRCPPGKSCVWQGELSAAGEAVNTQTGHETEFRFGTVKMPEAQILGYKFELVSIDARRKILYLHRLP